MAVRKFELVQRENGLWVILSRTGSRADVVETGHVDRNLAALDLASYASSQTLSPIGRGWLKVAERLAHNMKTQRNRRSERSDIISREDVLRLLMEQDYRCPISGSYFTHDAFEGDGIDPYQPSVDRADPSIGYRHGNVRIVCLLVNFAMSNWGEGPLREIAGRIVTLGLRPDEPCRTLAVRRPIRLYAPENNDLDHPTPAAEALT